MNKTNTAFEATEVIDSHASGALSSSKTKTWKDYLTLAKMGIVVSNLITTFAGLYLASVYTGVSLATNIHIVLLTLFGAGLVMAGGCTLNNYIDRDIDHLMERTKDRPTVTGKVEVNNVLWVGLLQAALGIFLLYLATPVAGIIGIIGLLVYVVIYTMWLKRTHSLNTIVGSVSGAVPPLIGWAAIDPGLHVYAWVMFLIMFFWQPPHFLALAMKRCEEYRAAGIPMLPVVAGFGITKRQMVLYVAALLPISLMLYQFGYVYTIVAALLGIGWLVLGFAGFFMKDDIKWARLMFVYSLNYLTIIFVLMVIVHLL
ncbi:heme o synthase [Desertibacillus haloalkaliphilus]|uniref:heme o synthase n=1 Tax=Desertibacillus haloalkaliphilus TaxID=1328930 RepID=UPI001C260012|nr:heme o synthase [Desertibacillus haloalkaliphilus]MBU8907156.1 heme o synthase [Desertibacillus haloalkaliphilus]